MLLIKNKQYLLPVLLLLLYFCLPSGLFAQVQEIEDFLVIQDTTGVRADQGQRKMHADVVKEYFEIAGYYRIYPKILYSSGDENESFYLTVHSQDGEVSTPLDPNAGEYKVVVDDHSPQRHTTWRDAGLFYFYKGNNVIKMHHIALLSQDEYPELFNGPIVGAESVKLTDSLQVIAEPRIDGALEIRAKTLHIDTTNTGTRAAVYPGENVDYELIVRNNYLNLIRFAKLNSTLPSLLSASQFSYPPNQQNENTISWSLPQIAPQDSFVITFTATLANEIPAGLTPLAAEAELLVPNDIDSTNNYAVSTVYAMAEPGDALADVSISLVSVTDSIAVINNDSINVAKPGENILYSLTVINTGPDSAQDLRVTGITPPLFNIDDTSIEPNRTNADSLIWIFEALAPDSIIQILYDGTLSASVSENDTLLIAQAQVSAVNDTLPGNNFAADTVRIIHTPAKLLVDISVSQYTKTDSFVINNNDTLNYARSGETYTCYILVENTGRNDAKHVIISDIFPDSVTVGNFQPSAAFVDQDSIAWLFPTIPARASRTVQFDATVPDTMPVGVNFLINKVYARADTEDSTKLADNSSIDTVYNVVSEITEPLADGALEIRAKTLHIDSTGGGKRAIVYPGEAVNYELIIRNNYQNIISSAKLNNKLPLLLAASQFSYRPEQQSENTIYWSLPQIAPQDSFVITFTATLANEIPAGLTPLAAEAELLVPNDIDSTNNYAVSTVYAMAEPGDALADVSISLVSVTDSIAVINNDSINVAKPGENILYSLTVINTGPDSAQDLRVTGITPPLFNIDDTSIEPNRTNADSLIWIFEALAPDSVIQILYDGTVSASVSENDTFLIAQAQVSAANDTLAENNFAADTVRIIHTPVQLLSDISISQYAITDSFVIDNGNMLKYARCGETYTCYIVVKNISQDDAQNVIIRDIFPDSVRVGNFQPAADFVDQDSIVWSFPTIPARAGRTVQFDATVPEIMPVGENQLINRAYVRAANEDSTKLDNNSSTNTVYNVVSAPIDLTPKIAAMPLSIDVTDSISVLVQVPVYTENWDLWIYMPDGRIEKSFADPFIAATPLNPDRWYTIDQTYRPLRLISSEKEEQLIFEIRTSYDFGRSDSAQAAVQVRSSNYLVLDRNVFRPESENPLGIRFKLSYRRVAQLDVYDITGRHIVKLAESVYDGGWNIYPWDGMKHNGQRIGSGVYLVTLRTDEFNSWKKFLIVR